MQFPNNIDCSGVAILGAVPAPDHPRLQRRAGVLLALAAADVELPDLLQSQGHREHDAHEIQLQVGLRQALR